MAIQGMLFVTMEPQPTLSLDQFHEWYNNEHGPTRLRMPSMFANGLRYQASDSLKPTFLAAYDVKDMSLLETPTYTNLRANRSPREAATIGQVDVKRYLVDLCSTRTAPDFVAAEQLPDSEAKGRVLVWVDLALTDAVGAEDAVVSWYEEEHIAMLAKVPGWLRTRRYRTSRLDGANAGQPGRVIALHEYAKVNGLGGLEHKAAMATSRRDDVFSKFVAGKSRRTLSLFYVFGPAPRDLTHLAPLPAAASFVSPDAQTKTTAGSGAGAAVFIESYVTASDGLVIPYRLEGNPAPDAPTLAFSNSLLTSWHMWDEVVEAIKKDRPEFRILRYNTRGRGAIPSPPVPTTMRGLADDLHELLVALRISKLHALIGVSLGGATTLQFAMAYPDYIGKFIACDCNVAGSENNTKAWKERIAIAKAPSDAITGIDGASSGGMRKLAGITVERWFHPLTVSEKKDLFKRMVDMVAENSLEGFEYGCQALWTFDLKPLAKQCRVPGLLVVGEGDGKGALVKAMDGFRGTIGNGLDLRIVPDSGHLPMFENATAFWAAIKDYL